MIISNACVAVEETYVAIVDLKWPFYPVMLYSKVEDKALWCVDSDLC